MSAARPAMLLSLGHVTVRSADFERTERFYCGLLGMRIGPRPAIPVPGRWYYVGDEAVVHVLPRTAGAGPEAGRQDAHQAGHPAGHHAGHHAGHPAAHDAVGTIDHFALNAEDRPAFEQRLKAAGQPFESRRLADSDTWQVFLTDPDGVRVELSFKVQRGDARAAGG